MTYDPLRVWVDSLAFPEWINSLSQPALVPAYTLHRDVVWHRLNLANELLRGVLPPAFRIDVRYSLCEDATYAYVRADSSILLCNRFDEAVQTIAQAAREGETRTSSVGESALLFALLHEVGHAVIAKYSIPVLGRTEDAADAFATYVLLNNRLAGRLIIATSAVEWFEAWQSARDDRLRRAGEEPDLSAIHGLPGQRGARLLCAVQSVVEPTGSACESDWIEQEQAWMLALARERARARERERERR